MQECKSAVPLVLRFLILPFDFYWLVFLFIRLRMKISTTAIAELHEAIRKAGNISPTLM
jgi:hypothetical protein